MFTKRKGEYGRSPLPETPDFSDWSARFQKRAEQFTGGQNEVSLTFYAPTIIALMADLHVGHPSVDYKRIDREADKICRTANMYVILVGDEIDNMHWNPGQFEQSEQTPEQLAYWRALLDYFARDNKLLHSIGGDHDGWFKKQGFDMKREMNERYGASYSTGPTYIYANVNRQKYKLAGAHQLPGHSIYNVTHPQMRAVRFGSMHGADVIFSGHNHKKGTAMAYQHEMGEPQKTHYLALGPYKAEDSWLAKKGYPKQKEAEMGGMAIKLEANRKEITVYERILEAR